MNIQVCGSLYFRASLLNLRAKFFQKCEIIFLENCEEGESSVFRFDIWIRTRLVEFVCVFMVFFVDQLLEVGDAFGVGQVDVDALVNRHIKEFRPQLFNIIRLPLSNLQHNRSEFIQILGFNVNVETEQLVEYSLTKIN